MKAWLARDPIPRYRERLLATGADAATIDAIEAASKAAVAVAEQFAREAPEPDPSVLMTQVWADGGSSWRGDGS